MKKVLHLQTVIRRLNFHTLEQQNTIQRLSEIYIYSGLSTILYYTMYAMYVHFNSVSITVPEDGCCLGELNSTEAAAWVVGTSSHIQLSSLPLVIEFLLCVQKLFIIATISIPCGYCARIYIYIV